MAPWLIITISIVGAVALAVLAAWLKIRFDRSVNVVQLKLNVLQDYCAQAKAIWLSKLLSAMVVGDTATAVKMLREFIETENTLAFFVENVARPLAQFVKEYDAQKKKEAAALVPKPKPVATAKK